MPMWGEQARAVAAAVVGGAGISVGSNGLANDNVVTSGTGTVIGAGGTGKDLASTEADFALRLKKFDDTDARFQNLAERLEQYRDALSHFAEAGVSLADALHIFFGDNATVAHGAHVDSSGGQKQQQHQQQSLSLPVSPVPTTASPLQQQHQQQQQQHQQNQQYYMHSLQQDSAFKYHAPAKAGAHAAVSLANSVETEAPVVSFSSLTNTASHKRTGSAAETLSWSSGAGHTMSYSTLPGATAQGNGSQAHPSGAGLLSNGCMSSSSSSLQNGATSASGHVAMSPGAVAGYGAGGGLTKSNTVPNSSCSHVADSASQGSDLKKMTTQLQASPGLPGSRGHIPTAFRAAQQKISGKWLDHFMKRFDDDVIKPIKDCLNQFPEVRAMIKERSSAQVEMQKRQKKLRDTGARVRDKQRKWRECSERYNMFDHILSQRFSYIERTQPNFVMPSLRALVALLDDFTRHSAATMRDVAALATAASPTIIRDFTPPPKQDITASTLSPIGNDDEGWDDAFDFDDDTTSALSTGDRPTSTTAESRSRSAGPAPRLTVDDPRRAVSGPPLTGTLDAKGNLLQRRNPSPPTSAPPAISADPVMLSENDVRISAVTVRASRPSSTESHHQASASVPVLPSEGSKSITGDQESRTDRRHVLMRLHTMYSYSPLETNELEMRPGDIIEVYEKHNSGWWYGRTNHVNGYFPHSYTRELTEQEELDYLNEKSRRRREKRKGHRRRDSYDSRRSGFSASQASNGTTLQGS